MAIQVTPRIALDEAEIVESFVRASGAGGQNVHKVSSAVRLHFDIASSPSLSDRVKHNLIRLGGSRVSAEGVLTLLAQEHRTQLRNREAAVERLVALIREAAKPPPPIRRETRPTLGSKRRRLDEKGRRGVIKAGRGSVREE